MPGVERPRRRCSLTIGVERRTCRHSNATPVGRRAPSRGSSMRIPSISPGTPHECDRASPKPSDCIKTSSPVGEREKRSFPRGRGTCRSKAGSLARTGRAARSRRIREGFELELGVCLRRGRIAQAGSARVHCARSSRPRVRREGTRNISLAVRQRAHPSANSRFPAFSGPWRAHPCPSVCLRGTLTGARATPAASRRRLRRPPRQPHGWLEAHAGLH